MEKIRVVFLSILWQAVLNIKLNVRHLFTAPVSNSEERLRCVL